ncbi:MAG: tellurite resistance TerB family protein [Kiloniellales bacterium]|nr:tellurite resistance TerB family protein [Kiloniellales bacterium]MDJ0972216.1 tellurite resistance TerB family protein [Kiloniellales bacterium]MDJ0981024.1 tellurite resistance TerB family protein [Kiloniellales bacterium]
MADTHSALIYTMVLVSAADRNMTDSELKSMGEIVRYLPVFRDYDPDSLPKTAKKCAELLGDDQGLDKALEIIAESVPERLRETAYAIACDVAAADGKATQEELRLLEMLRHRLQVGRLAAAAIERGSRARHQTL